MPPGPGVNTVGNASVFLIVLHACYIRTKAANANRHPRTVLIVARLTATNVGGGLILLNSPPSRMKRAWIYDNATEKL
jgi:hypothetical protein